MDDTMLETGDPGSGRGSRAAAATATWPAPAYQVIALDCEITAYAPDEGDWPLF